MEGFDTANSPVDRWAILRLTALVVVVVGFGVLVWHKCWMSDDGLINVRIVQHLLDGHGPVFNIGERVEAYTSPAWVAVIGLLTSMGLRAEHAAVGAGIVFSTAGLACAQVAALWLWTCADKWKGCLAKDWFVPVGAVIYASVPVAWDYGTSGLENGLSLFWLGGTYLFVTVLSLEKGNEGEERGRLASNAAAVMVGLGPLVRPELGLFSVVFAIPLLLSRARKYDQRFCWKSAIEMLGIAALLPVAYEIWRMGYFAAFVPNTAIAKAAFHSRWQQGWYYVENFFGLYELAIPLTLMFLFVVERVARFYQRHRWIEIWLMGGPIAAGLVYCTYLIRIGGGFMHGRLFLPPLFGMLLPVAVVRLRDRNHNFSGWRVGAFVAILAWAIGCAWLIRVPKENQHGIGDERGWYVRNAGVSNPITVGDYGDMYFAEDARGPRRTAERHCPSAFPNAEQSSGEDEKECERVVYVDNEKAGKLRPERETYPLRQRVADNGIVLAALRTGIGLRSLVMSSKIHVVDRAGLASPIGSRVALTDRGRPGHERQLNNQWFVGRFAAFPPEKPTPAVISAARRALDCGRLERLDRAVTAPLTPSRFLHNIGEAFRLDDLTIPRSPHEAEAKFCGISLPKSEMIGGSGGTDRQWYCPNGYVLAGLSVTQNAEREALSNVRPECRRLESKDGVLTVEDEVLEGPRFGGETSKERKGLSCGDGRIVKSLQIVASDLVEGIGIDCGKLRASDSGRPKVEVSEGDASEFVGPPEGGETLSCPDESLPAGVAVRAGALVDAVGLRCRHTVNPP